MIIARSPLRITLGGGGTDLPAYYEKFGAFFISAAIDKYVYVILNRRMDSKFRIRSLSIQEVSHIDEVKHSLIRECCKILNFDGRNMELVSISDLPGNTGLGSSGAFCCSLLAALGIFQKRKFLPKELAELACQVEMLRLNRTVGKQDPYASSYGGIHSYTIDRKGNVVVKSIKLSEETRTSINKQLLLFYIGKRDKSAKDILLVQDRALRNHSLHHTRIMKSIMQIGIKSNKALEAGDIETFGELMNEHWHLKKQMDRNMSRDFVDQCYEISQKSGAIGGKIVGAGQSGFLLLCVKEYHNVDLIKVMRRLGLLHLEFSLEVPGTQVSSL